MATLTNTTIAATYTLLLKIDSSGVDSTLRKVEDGDATDSALSIATTSIAIDATDKFGFDGTDTGTYITEASDGVLDFYADAVQMLSLVEGGTDYVWVPVDATKMALGAGKDLQLYTSSDDSYIENITSDKDIILRVNDGGSNSNMVTLDASDQRVLVASSVASASDTGAHLRLYADDGALMGDGHRLGVIEFAGAEDSSNNITVGARIEAITDAAWSASENGADMVFYTTDGNASQSEVIRLGADRRLYFYDKDGEYISGDGTDLTITSGTDILLAAGGNIGIGITTMSAPAGADPKVQIEGTDADNSGLSIWRNTAGASGPYFTIGHSRGAGLNSVNALVDNDILGTIQWSGGDGSDRSPVGANIFARIDGDPASNDMPTELVFGTTPDGGSAAPTERMVIAEDGNIGIGAASPTLAQLQITSTGANAGLRVYQDQAQNGLALVQDGNSNAINIDNNGTSSAFYIENTGSTGRAMQIYSNIGDTASSPLVQFEADNAGFDQEVLKVMNDGTSYGISIDQNGNAIALYIDSEATTAKTMHIAASVNTSGDIFTINDANALTSGSMLYLQSDSSSTTARKLINLVNDNTAAVATIPLYIQQDSTEPAISTTGGIVEQGGVLKENLLRNSGFDVWSNSTPANMGSLLNTNGTFEADDNWSAAGSPTTEERSSEQAHGGTYSWKVTTDALNEGIVQDTDSMYNVVAGKLYRMRAWVYITADKYLTMGYLTTGCTGRFASTTFQIINPSTNTWTEMDVTLEATTSGTIRQRFISTSTVMTFYVDDFTVYEVTPGCDAADTLAPDGWSKQSGMRVYRKEWIDVGHASNTVFSKDGSYYALYNPTNDSADKTLFNGVNLNSDGSEIEIERFLGRTITVGAWVYAKNGAANHASISVHDNVNGSSTDTHSGSAGWEWLEATHTVASNATSLYSFRFTTSLKAGSATDPPSTNADEVWMSQPMLVFGSSIGEGNYTRPQGEVVDCETNIGVIENESPGASDDKILYLEGLTNGKVPRGCRAVNVVAQVKNSSITSDQGITFGADSTRSADVLVHPSVNDVWQDGTGKVRCDGNGDIYQKVTEAGSTLSGSYLTILSVQLH